MIFSIIIPVYGQWQLLKNCLLSLKKEINIPFELILVDNGANVLEKEELSEEVIALGKKLFNNNFIYLPQEKNLNFAGACNLGAKTATTPLLFFLNSDTEVLPNFLPPLLEAMQESSQMKMIGPLLLYPPKNKGEDYTIQHLGVFIAPASQIAHLYEHFPANHRVVQTKRKLQCITAAAILIYKEHFLNTGGFDEEFRNGFEDVDFCGRFLKEGGIFDVIAESKILHLCSQSVGRNTSNDHNKEVLRKKNGVKYFTSDYHTLLEADNYELHYNEMLELTPHLNKKLNDSLKSLIQENNLKILKMMHAKEPYWHDGLRAIVKHKDMTLKEKADYLYKANDIHLEPDLFFHYLKIVSSVSKLDKNSIHEAIKNRFNINIANKKEYEKSRRMALESVLLHLKDCSEILYKDCLYNIENNKIFINNFYKTLDDLYSV